MKKLLLVMFIMILGVFSYAENFSVPVVPGYEHVNIYQLTATITNRVSSYDYEYLINNASIGEKFVFFATIALEWEDDTLWFYMLNTNNWKNNTSMFSNGLIIIASPYIIKGLHEGENILIYVTLETRIKLNDNAFTVPMFLTDYILVKGGEGRPVLLDWSKSSHYNLIKRFKESHK